MASLSYLPGQQIPVSATATPQPIPRRTLPNFLLSLFEIVSNPAIGKRGLHIELFFVAWQHQTALHRERKGDYSLTTLFDRCITNTYFNAEPLAPCADDIVTWSDDGNSFIVKGEIGWRVALERKRRAVRAIQSY